jgi:hypothetical protein
MTAELRLTVGEIAFAVGVVSTLDRALDIVGLQLDAPEPERAKMALAASGQSLLARELASRTERDVRLAPPLQAAAEIIAGSEYLLRCVRVEGKRTEQVFFHLAPTGVLAQVVEGSVVHRVAPVQGVGGLIERASGFFGLPPAEHDNRPVRPVRPVRIERRVLEDLGRLSGAAEIGRELTARGVPEAVSTPFAADLAAARWKGGVTLDHSPKGQRAGTQTSLLIVAGLRYWLIDTHAPEAATLGAASRERFGDAVKAILRTLDSTTRKLDRAGELEL